MNKFTTSERCNFTTMGTQHVETIGSPANNAAPLYICSNGSGNGKITKGTAESAAYDLCANIESPLEICPGKVYRIPTGVSVAIPGNYFGKVEGRSGLAAKYGTIIHGGVIDSDYRGEICVLISSLTGFIISPGDRIAQLLFCSLFPDINIIFVSDKAELPSALAVHEGFGSTGK